MPLAILLPESPIAAENTRQPVKTSMLVAPVALVLVSAIIYGVIFVAEPGYSDLFSGFGTDLPMFTKTVLASSKYFVVFILVGLIPCLLLLSNRRFLIADSRRLFILVIVGFGLSLSLLAVFVTAMYLPIFQMGTIV